jgi:hypothetical protein
MNTNLIFVYSEEFRSYFVNITIIRMVLINSFLVAGSVNWITFFGYEYGFFEISYSTMIICADTFGLIAIIA